MLLSVAFVMAGLTLMVFASGHFVRGAARVSLALHLSPVLVGVVVVGFGTSSPELLVGVLAAARGEVGIAIGSIVGSNVANLTLIAGAAAIVTPLAISGQVLRRELPLATLGVVALGAVTLGALTRLEGALLLAMFALVIGYLIRASLRVPADEPLGTEAQEFAGQPRVRLGREVARLVLGLAGTVGGAHMLVVGASDAASRFGVSESVIGLTLVAVGTSLPELVTSVQAARQGETELVIGNLLGSNLFNSLAISGIALLIDPASADGNDLAASSAAIMVVIMLVAAATMWTGRRLHRWEGGGLLVIYAGIIAVFIA